VTPFDASALLSKLRGSANTSNTSGSGNHRANGGTASKSGGGATPMSLSSSGNGNASGGLFTSGNNNAGTRDFVYESSNGVGSFAELVKVGVRPLFPFINARIHTVLGRTNRTLTMILYINVMRSYCLVLSLCSFIYIYIYIYIRI
jgi:hypothetical protein